MIVWQHMKQFVTTGITKYFWNWNSCCTLHDDDSPVFSGLLSLLVHDVSEPSPLFDDGHPHFLELGRVLLGHIQVLPQAGRETGVFHLQKVRVWTVLVAEKQNIKASYSSKSIRGVSHSINDCHKSQWTFYRRLILYGAMKLLSLHFAPSGTYAKPHST